MSFERPDFPERLNIEPTNVCSMRCRLCPHVRMGRPKGFMDPALFARLARECARHGASVWLQYMGEPLMHPRILDLIGLAREAGVRRIGLSTNGEFLDSELAEGLVARGLDRLECSVDATDPAGFLENRGSTRFDTVISNIENFLSLRKAMGSETPVTSVQYLDFSLAPGERLTEVRRFWKDRLGPRDFIMRIRDYSFAGTVRTPLAEGPRLPCRWPFRYGVILWDGTMALCGSDFDGTASVGNVSGESVQDLWLGEAFEKVRSLHRTGQWDRLPLCAGCDDWALADGSGYTNALEEAGGDS